MARAPARRSCCDGVGSYGSAHRYWLHHTKVTRVKVKRDPAKARGQLARKCVACRVDEWRFADAPRGTHRRITPGRHSHAQEAPCSEPQLLLPHGGHLVAQ